MVGVSVMDSGIAFQITGNFGESVLTTCEICIEGQLRETGFNGLKS